MEIRKTRPDDLGRVLQIYAHGREIMRRIGNPTQWGDNRPPKEAIVGDIARGDSYVLVNDGAIVGVFMFAVMHDPTYDIIKDGAWLNQDEYGVIHRIASDESCHGVLAAAVAFASERAGEIRIDTHRNNGIMRHTLGKLGFTECGIIYTDDGTERIAYQKHTKEK